MKNSHAIRPRPQELNESIRRPEDILGLAPKLVMLEPKFDGSFIYITRDPTTGRTVLCTKDGNELRLESQVQHFLERHFRPWAERYLFEAELEPCPWSEAAKIKLNGNLYSGKPMPFPVRVALHDVLPVEEIFGPKTTAWERYQTLRQLAGEVSANQEDLPVQWVKDSKVSVCVTPCRVVSRQQAAELFVRGWEAGKGQKRVMFASQPYEGLVLINPGSVYQPGRSNKWKVKPFHSLDLQVQQVTAKTGRTTIFEVQAVEIKTGQPVKLYTGINSEQFEELQRAARNYREVIIEVEALAIKELPYANPTFKAIRYDRMQLKTTTHVATDPEKGLRWGPSSYLGFSDSISADASAAGTSSGDGLVAAPPDILVNTDSGCGRT